ncbi:methylmalonyl-CoA mutase [Anopheles sinensis]|uniref:Methylmalonyl-CoA mutase n=1 Tax=Anopheles sinensis TaxID=74873 RepID=A0A084W6X3_ANOSI|nr:methylmalonyl-CoA mutase [Anopheles sinensis]
MRDRALVSVLAAFSGRKGSPPCAAKPKRSIFRRRQVSSRGPAFSRREGLTRSQTAPVLGPDEFLTNVRSIPPVRFAHRFPPFFRASTLDGDGSNLFMCEEIFNGHRKPNPGTRADVPFRAKRRGRVTMTTAHLVSSRWFLRKKADSVYSNVQPGDADRHDFAGMDIASSSPYIGVHPSVKTCSWRNVGVCNKVRFQLVFPFGVAKEIPSRETRAFCSTVLMAVRFVGRVGNETFSSIKVIRSPFVVGAGRPRVEMT